MTFASLSGRLFNDPTCSLTFRSIGGCAFRSSLVDILPRIIYGLILQPDLYFPVIILFFNLIVFVLHLECDDYLLDLLRCSEKSMKYAFQT